MAEPRPPSRGLVWLADAPVVVMAVGIGFLLWRTISGRLSHPYDLEWMEGGMLLHAQRVADGLPLYVTPTEEFIPFIYPPLYPWLVGGLSHWFELDYALGRTISIVGIVAAAVALVLAVRKEGGGLGLGAGAAGMFLACYPDSGAFFDLVRNDGLLMGLLAWSLLAIRCGWIRAGGLLLTAAFATKHTAALFGLPALWWLWHHEGREKAQRFVGWSVIPAVVFTLWMTIRSDNLFLTYVLSVPSAHPFVGKRLVAVAPKELALALPWTSGLVVLVALAWRRARSRGHRFWVAQGVLALLLAMVMRGHHGGFLNVLIPGFWVLALWGALAASAVRTRFPRLGVYVLTSALIAWQMWAVRWSPSRYIPTEADRAAGDAVVEQLRAVEGDILAPWSPYLPAQAGKSGSIALIALWDIDHEGGPLQKEAQVIAKSIAAKRWGAVLKSRGKLGRGLKQHYRKGAFVRPPAKTMYTKTGWRVRPNELWVPR